MIFLIPVDSSVTSRPCTWFQSLAFISNLHSSGIGTSWIKSSIPGSFNQSGPDLQSTLTESSSGPRPLDGMSAGLSWPAQCLQQSVGVSFLISETRFCTKGFQSFSNPRIQCSATVESVKQCGAARDSSDSRL